MAIHYCLLCTGKFKKYSQVSSPMKYCFLLLPIGLCAFSLCFRLVRPEFEQIPVPVCFVLNIITNVRL